MITTDYLHVDSTGALADKAFVGFQHLQAEGAAPSMRLTKLLVRLTRTELQRPSWIRCIPQ